MPMKVRVPVMVQDPEVARYKGMRIVEDVLLQNEDFFLDGPITSRVAVLDFDSKTGELLPGTRFLLPSGGRKVGGYAVGDENDIESPDFIRVSVFGMVLKTMDMFEDKDNLGRPLTWSFGAPQLLLVPRAGEWANAFYERASHSIQFFYFTSENRKIYTALSRDIVAHETGHAILDGIVPDLYHAVSPQSLALHEAMADLTALIMAYSSDDLREVVLEQTNGSIQDPTAFASIAEEFGLASGRDGSLRDLRNQFSLNPDDPERVSRTEPHLLSQVLSGGLFSVMVRMHAERAEQEHRGGKDPLAAAGRALGIVGERFKRMVVRALDYLPPGEVSFGDYARALIASDQASYPRTHRERDWICEEFLKRGVVPTEEDLKVSTNFDHPALADVDLATLVDSDWAAYSFANANRDLLGIPPDIPFRVRPRLDAVKNYRHREGTTPVRECIFKVSWDQQEPNEIGAGFPDTRVITVGSTLAIDWNTKKVRARLIAGSSEQDDRARSKTLQSQELDQQRADRTQMLKRMIDEEIFQIGPLAEGPDGKPLRSLIEGQSINNIMRVRGTTRMLHLAQGV